MNIFGFRPFKGKFNLGNSDDIPTNQDGTLIGSVKKINSDLANKANSEIANYNFYSVAIVGKVVTVSGRTSGSSYAAGSVIVSNLPLSVGGYLPVMLFNATMSTHQYGYLLDGKLYTENAISGGTAHFAFSYVKATS